MLTLSTNIVNEIVHDFSIDPKKVHLYRYRISEIFNPSVTKSLKPSLNPIGPVVLTVCRMDRGKGLEYLISASAIIVKNIPNVKIVIKGSSYKSSPPSVRKYEDELRQEIQELKLDEKVTILNFSRYSDIPEYLAAADVFVLSSITEGMPLALMEAMATGLPVVATRVGGIPEILVDGINGLLVNPRDANALASSIIAILSNSDLRRKLSTGALRTIEDIRENELEKLLNKLLFQD
jgi:glycosyltransferase involved in cell wall biosynthesis